MTWRHEVSSVSYYAILRHRWNPGHYDLAAIIMKGSRLRVSLHCKAEESKHGCEDRGRADVFTALAKTDPYRKGWIVGR